MGFDAQNFGIGVLAGWASAYGMYRARHVISRARLTVTGRAASAQTYATLSAETRYVKDLVEYAQHAHLAGRFIPFSSILIEPRFLQQPELAVPKSEEVVRSVFHIVPQVPDHPYLQAPYNIETMSIEDLALGDRAIALLGLPGSGRTSALLAIALYSLGEITLEQQKDSVQQRLDAEDAALSEKDRAQRIKERLMIEQRARDRLKETGGDPSLASALDEKSPQSAVSPFKQLMPVYLHLADLVFNPGAFGSEVDPAEPLVRAVQRSVSRVTASTIPRNLYTRLGKGGVLLLLDGYDELNQSERPVIQAWLTAFRQTYGHNFIIVSGSSYGYGTLSEIGFTPVYLRPWSDLDIRHSAEQWAAAWPQIGAKGKRSAALDPALVQRAQTGSRALSAVEMTLKLWGTYADDAQAAGLEGWLRAFITRHLPEEMALGTILPQLIKLAVLELDESTINQVQVEALFTAASLPIDEPETEVEEAAKSNKKSAAKTASKETDANAHLRFLNQLARHGLLVRRGEAQYSFCHSVIASYLASLNIKNSAPAEVASKSKASYLWNEAVAFAGMHSSIDEIVKARLDMPNDVLHTHVLDISRWVAYQGTNSVWRGPLLKRLGILLISPSQYPYTRERVASALVGTRDRSILFIFRQAARNADASVRRLACLAMGSLGDPEGIQDLIPLLQDQDSAVQLAAGLGLGAIGTEAALEQMAIALTSGSDQLRQAIAEAFAALPEEGHPALYDAVQHQDMMLRRAAVFGLRRIRSNWALVALYRTSLEDEQWYVRSAAQQALQESQAGSVVKPTRYPPPEALNWLNEWASTQGEGVPPGAGAHAVLIKALHTAEPEIRTLSALVLGQMGVTTAIRPLYTALRDRQPEVRAAAYQALSELALSKGKVLPNPI